jgi:hypothetical protein
MGKMYLPKEYSPTYKHGYSGRGKDFGGYTSMHIPQGHIVARVDECVSLYVIMNWLQQANKQQSSLLLNTSVNWRITLVGL